MYLSKTSTNGTENISVTYIAEVALISQRTEKLSTFKSHAQGGDLPLELEIQKVFAHPPVSSHLSHLMPLPPQPAAQAPQPTKSPRAKLHGSPPALRNAKGNGKGKKDSSKPRPKCIRKDLANITRDESLRWKKDELMPSEKCPRGLHLCFEPNCQKPGSMQQHDWLTADVLILPALEFQF